MSIDAYTGRVAVLAVAIVAARAGLVAVTAQLIADSTPSASRNSRGKTKTANVHIQANAKGAAVLAVIARVALVVVVVVAADLDEG